MVLHLRLPFCSSLRKEPELSPVFPALPFTNALLAVGPGDQRQHILLTFIPFHLQHGQFSIIKQKEKKSGTF